MMNGDTHSPASSLPLPISLSFSACYSLLPSLSASTESVTQLLAHLQDSFDFSNLLEIIYQSDPCLPNPSPLFAPAAPLCSFQKVFGIFVFVFGIFVSVALLIGDYERKSTKYFTSFAFIYIQRMCQMSNKRLDTL